MRMAYCYSGEAVRTVACVVVAGETHQPLRCAVPQKSHRGWRGRMHSLEHVRALFPKPAGDEAHIVTTIQRLFDKIDAKKQGTMIGKKRTVDYEALVKQMSFPAQMSSEEEVMDRLAALYEGVVL